MIRGDHKFTGPNLSSHSISMTINTNAAYSLNLTQGSMPQRSDSYARQFSCRAKTLRIHEQVDGSWFKNGCYLQSSRGRQNHNERKTYELLCDLEKLYLMGENNEPFEIAADKPNASKYTPEEARSKLMNLLLQDGRRKYSPTSKYGRLPSVTYIRNFFSQRSSGKRLPIKLGLDQYESSSTKELEVMCRDRNLPIKGKTQLVKILELHDMLNGENYSLEPYTRKSVRELKQICQSKLLPHNAGSKNIMKKMLRLFDNIQNEEEEENN